MKIAIMQPYFFPYLGYFQLIASVDHFIFLDDVNFIKRGWVNRNVLIFNGEKKLFSVPLEKINQSTPINQTRIAKTEFLQWKAKFSSSLQHFYKRQKFFSECAEYLNNLLAMDVETISDLACMSLAMTSRKLGIITKFSKSSDLRLDNNLKRENKIIGICKYFMADVYINAQGGKTLYSASMFSPFGIKLEFIQPKLLPYPVKDRAFIPGLSVLDALMCCGSEYIARNLLDCFELQEAL